MRPSVLQGEQADVNRSLPCGMDSFQVVAPMPPAVVLTYVVSGQGRMGHGH